MAQRSALARFLGFFGLREADFTHDERRQAVNDALNPEGSSKYRYVRDMLDDQVVYGEGNDLYRAGYTIGDDRKATLADEPHEKVRVTYVPMGEPAAKAEAAAKATANLNEDHQGDFERMSHDDQVAHLKDDHDADDQTANHSSEELDREHDQAHKNALAQDSARSAADANLTELAEAALVGQLEEKALARDGTFSMRIIAPGLGSSGYYSKEVLSRDGAKAFPAGTHMFMDHPTESQDRDRPERSVRDLGGVTVSDPVYEEKGFAGPGLYARAQAIGEMARDGVLDTMAPHIGVSIRASGRVSEGEIEGKKVPIVEELVQGHSIDYVTRAGAGGTIRSVMESARKQLHEASSRVTAAGDTTTAKEDKGMADKTAEQRLAESETRSARLEEALAIRDARDFAVTELRASSLPDVTKARIVETVSKNPPMKDGFLDRETFKATVTEAAKTETEYLARLTNSGSVRGMGEGAQITTTELKPEDRDQRFKEAFGAMGLSGKVLDGAVAGRLS